jgi:glycosyltransferase involved in cell wall biosynthesis
MKVAVIVDSVPSYRKGFYEKLLRHPDIELTVYCQSHIKGFNLKLVHNELGNSFVEVPFYSMDRHRCVWQRLPIKKLWKDFEVYFFVGNPRIVSTLFYATAFRALGKSVVIWGQAHTAGANSRTESLRLRWWNLFKNLLTYTDSEVEYLRQRGFRQENIAGMNNGLDQDAIEIAISRWPDQQLREWQSAKGVSSHTVVLSCARLEEKNQFSLMIDALPLIVKSCPDFLWCVIGVGRESENLRKQAATASVEDHILWIGEVYDEYDLAPWFLSSRVLVHPGAIGLTLMHAFGYGVPVVTHDDFEFQMPEIAAFEDGINGLLFANNNVAELAATVVALLNDRRLATRLGRSGLQAVQSKYNTSAMAQRFVDVARIARDN